jgi:hypothetical protein
MQLTKKCFPRELVNFMLKVFTYLPPLGDGKYIWIKQNIILPYVCCKGLVIIFYNILKELKKIIQFLKKNIFEEL